tara:strand:+ start:2724 stop:5843 length:3120 start_codon:yes stop_codon:yes gene_type:complete
METFNLPSLTESEIDGLKPRRQTRTESMQTLETSTEEKAGALKPAVQLLNTLGSEDVKAGMVVGPWNAITNLTNATGDLIQRKPIDVSDNYLKISDETTRQLNPFRLGREGVTKSDESGLDLGEAAGAEIAGWYTGASILKMGSRAAWLYSLTNALRRSRKVNTGIKSAVAVDRAKRWADRGKFAARWSLSTSFAAPFFDYSEGNLSNLTEDLINRYFETDIDLPLSVKPGDNYLDSFGKGWATDAFAMPIGILGFSGLTRNLVNIGTDAFTTAKSVPVEIMDNFSDSVVNTYKPALEKGFDGLPVGQKGGELATYDSAISRAISEQTQIKQVTDQRDRLTKMGLIEVGENNQLELIYPGVVNKEIKGQFDAIRSQRGQLIKQANATGEDITKQLDELDKAEEQLTELSMAGDPAAMGNGPVVPRQRDLPDVRPELDTFLAYTDELSDIQLRELYTQVNIPARRQAQLDLITQQSEKVKSIQAELDSIPEKLKVGAENLATKGKAGKGGLTELGGKRKVKALQKDLEQAQLDLDNLTNKDKQKDVLVGDQLKLGLDEYISPAPLIDPETGAETTLFSWINKVDPKDIKAGDDAVNRIIQSFDKAFGTQWKNGPIESIGNYINVANIGRVTAEEIIKKASRDVQRLSANTILRDAKADRIANKKPFKEAPIEPKAKKPLDPYEGGPPTYDVYKNDLMQLHRDELRSAAAPSSNPEIAAIVTQKTGRRVWQSKKSDIVEAFVEYYKKTGFYGRPLLPGEGIQTDLGLGPDDVKTTSKLGRSVDPEGVESMVPQTDYKPRGMQASEREMMKQGILEAAIRNGEIQPPSSPLPERPTTNFNQESFIDEFIADETGQLSMLYNANLIPAYEAGGKNSGAIIDEFRLRSEYQELDTKSLRAQKEAWIQQNGWEDLPFEEKRKLGLYSKWEYALKGEDVVDNKLINNVQPLKNIQKQQEKLIKTLEPKPPKKPKQKMEFTAEGIVPEETVKKTKPAKTTKKAKRGSLGDIQAGNESVRNLDLAEQKAAKKLQKLQKQADANGGICK